jgi:hypothetical protein
MSFIAAGVAGAVAIGGAALTASMQAKASKEAAQTQAASADEATALQREMYYQQREDIAPWRRAGVQALGGLQRMIRQGPGTPFNAPPRLGLGRFAFTPPTPESLATDPGYQFRLRSGQQALEGSAAARGGLLSGGALRGLTEFGQQLGSQEYQQAYNRALGENELRYGRALTGNQERYNRALAEWQSRQGLQQQQYNRLAGLANVGQQANQYLGELGGSYAQNVGNILQSRGATLAAGQIGASNAWGNALNTGVNTVGNLAGMYLQRPVASPAQAGYAYNPNSVPFNQWEFMGQ